MLRYALLELLRRKPLTGYDIRQRFQQSVMFCWHAHLAQIYPELRRLEGEKLVSSKCKIQTHRPNKTIYAITRRGREALAAWQKAALIRFEMKDDVLLRVYGIDAMAAADGAALLALAARAHAERLATYEAIKEKIEARYGALRALPNDSLLGPLLCLEWGLRYERMYRDWCAWAVQRLTERGGRNGPNGSQPMLDLYGLAAPKRAPRARRPLDEQRQQPHDVKEPSTSPAKRSRKARERC